jgi:hypothetical protein
MSPASPCTVAGEVYIPPMNSLVGITGTGDPIQPYTWSSMLDPYINHTSRLQPWDTSFVWNWAVSFNRVTIDTQGNKNEPRGLHFFRFSVAKQPQMGWNGGTMVKNLFFVFFVCVQSPNWISILDHIWQTWYKNIQTQKRKQNLLKWEEFGPHHADRGPSQKDQLEPCGQGKSSVSIKKKLNIIIILSLEYPNFIYSSNFRMSIPLSPLLIFLIWFPVVHHYLCQFQIWFY